MATTPYTAPNTAWATGNVVGASDMNTLATDIVGAWSPPMAQAYRNTNLSIANTTWTDVTMANENFDTDSIHDNVTNPARFTVPANFGGNWTFEFVCEFAASAGGNIRFLRFSKNGTTTVQVCNSGTLGGGFTVDLAAVFTFGGLIAGDYVTAQVYQDSGGALNITSATGTFKRVSN